MSDRSFGENLNKLTVFNNFFLFLEILQFMRMWKDTAARQATDIVI